MEDVIKKTEEVFHHHHHWRDCISISLICSISISISTIHQVLPLLSTMERLLESPEEWELPVSPDKVLDYILEEHISLEYEL